MIYAFIIFLLYRRSPRIIDNLRGFGTLWGQLLSVTTFTLTFFLNQSFSLWRKCTQLSRRLQGRLHDIGMNLATHATRELPAGPNESSKYTPQSRQILELMSRYVRVFNLLCYASFTRSHRPILTPRGMRRLVERGLLTAQERQVLVDAAIPPTQRHSAVLMWMIRLFVEGRASGHILGGDGFEQATMDKFHVIRAQYGGIGDELQGRMPLAYAHIVQILVDLILWMYPVMAFSTGMSPFLVIAGTGLLTISYQGLFDLAKQFLDPYDNENYGKGEDPLSVDTLIAETNAGSVRWWFGFEEMPFNGQLLRDGELYDSLLPVRGYSVQDLAEMEEERIKQEKLKEEEEQREEEERLKREEKEKEEMLNEQKEELEEPLTLEQEVISESNETIVSDGIDDVAIPIMDKTVSNETVPMDELEEDFEDLDLSTDKDVHRVVTLGGNPVSLKKLGIEIPEPTIMNTKPVATKLAVPLAASASTYLASLSTTEEREEVDEAVSTEEESQSEPELTKLTSEEYQTKLQEIEEAIEKLNAAAQPEDVEDIELVISKKKKEKIIEEEVEEDKPTRMTLEDYEDEVERIIIEAKEEMLETEAILSTKSGLDPLEWDYDDEQLESMTSAQDSEDGTEVKLEGSVSSIEKDEPELDETVMLDALEMDLDDEVESTIDLVVDQGEDDEIVGNGDALEDQGEEDVEIVTDSTELSNGDHMDVPNGDDVKPSDDSSDLSNGDQMDLSNGDHAELSNGNEMILSNDEAEDSSNEDSTDESDQINLEETNEEFVPDQDPK